ncbi:MAG: twin-arginine translocase subunit TatC [Gemmatimonadaceae bacterium]|nr:twin-arginine translocase subunit TatC [Gemmatimonadaceae bacterium]
MKLSVNETTEMPFLDHLEELRHRLFWIAGALLIGVVIGFMLLSQIDLIRFLEQPIAPYLHGQKLIYTHPGTSFGIVMNASVVIGILLAAPVAIYQIWGFLSPALYKHEKKMVLPIFVAVLLLFVAGLALSFYVVLPFTLKFLLGFESDALTPMISATEYFSFAITMCLVFGVVFQLPIVILLLTAIGLVTPAFLNKYRRHAIVLCIVAAAFITPGADPTSLFALSIPLYFLFEASVVASRVVYGRKQKRAARRAALEDATTDDSGPKGLFAS